MAGVLRCVGVGEAELGARPVALGLGVDGAEGEVDAWTSLVVLFGHLMLLDEREARGTFKKRFDLKQFCSYLYVKM